LAFATAPLIVCILTTIIGVTDPVRADPSAPTGAAPIDTGIASAWRTLRAADCARCHGKDYDGLAAPSIVDYARSRSQEDFARMVLNGNPPRGMPAYRDNPAIVDQINEIYRYFKGRAIVR
jgi:mono/diheme cytochrome c family protein